VLNNTEETGRNMLTGGVQALFPKQSSNVNQIEREFGKISETVE
jgi:hypothetical protein